MNFKYLKYVELPYFDGNAIWSICPYTGSLLKQNTLEFINKIKVPEKVSNAILYCNEPYLCKSNLELVIDNSKIEIIKSISKMHSRLIKISNKRFFYTKIYSSNKKILFNDTVEAITCINLLPLQVKLKHQLCLQRAFLASKISKSFISNGVIFIGAFLPTGDMHAWIIEDGMQPDYDDRGWVNYRPLLAFFN